VTRLGTAQMRANRLSERADQFLRALVYTLVQLLGTLLVGSFFGMLLLMLYRGLDERQFWAQFVGGLVAVGVWVTLAREEAKRNRREAIRAEQRRRADGGEASDRTARLEGHRDAGPYDQLG